VGKEFKILSIDGGGFRGAYSAHLLKQIEEKYSINWLEDFDLITGTSTGSIIAAGLACGKTAGELAAIYEEHGKDIFKKRWPGQKGFVASRYNNKGLSSQLDEIFGETKLGEVGIPLIIPATNIGLGCVHVFKSKFDEGFVRDPEVLVRDAVLASCSAPTYFAPHKVKENLLADGGLWANSPSLVAAIDAKKRLNQKLEDLRVLSIGTGHVKTFYPQKISLKRGLWGWGFLTRWRGGKFIEMILNLQSQNAANMLGLLLETEQILRLNFESDQAIPLDDPNEYSDLIARAAHTFTHQAADIDRFVNSTTGESL
jgi:patatin-like phospholipase/acyl hydrolase